MGWNDLIEVYGVIFDIQKNTLSLIPVKVNVGAAIECLKFYLLDEEAMLMLKM